MHFKKSSRARCNLSAIEAALSVMVCGHGSLCCGPHARMTQHLFFKLVNILGVSGVCTKTNLWISNETIMSCVHAGGKYVKGRKGGEQATSDWSSDLFLFFDKQCRILKHIFSKNIQPMLHKQNYAGF